MDFLKRVDYTKGFTALFILTGISFTFLLLFVLYIEFTSFQHSVNVDKAKHEVILKKEKIKEFYEHYDSFLAVIEHNRFFSSFLKDTNLKAEEDLVTLFITLVQNEKYITQLRYIDEKGQEKLRVDRNTLNGEINLIDKNNLQNKFNRDYFQKAISKKANEIYVSNLDLNIENGKIELPYKPVWRFAIPVFSNYKSRGIIIVNIFGKYILEDIIKSKDFFIDIFDKDGDILVSSFNNKNEWTKYLKGKSLLEKENFIYTDTLVEGLNDEIFYIGLTQKDWLADFYNILNYKYLLILIFIFLCSYALAYYLSKIPRKLFNELEEQQKLLIQQSKFSAMGEMTSMLAHQWRQPLNAISVLQQEIKLHYNMDTLDDEIFNNNNKKIQKTLTHMSKTIDNFKNFFKPSKEKEEFNVQEAIKIAYDVLQLKLDSSSVKYNILLENNISDDCLIINSYKGEFEQVIINIISNAIDALEETTLEEKWINTNINCKENVITIEITDNAGGIKNNILSKIFEPYFSTKMEKNGTGLGLYMSKIIIEKNMNGKISALNKTHGASFMIELNKTNFE